MKYRAKQKKTNSQSEFLDNPSKQSGGNGGQSLLFFDDL